MTQKQFTFSAAFRKKNLIALLGCGSTPGITNVMAAYAIKNLDTVDHIDLGFSWDSNIKQFVLPYSYESIVYELTTPAIVLEKGRFKKMKTCALEGITRFLKVGRHTTYRQSLSSAKQITPSRSWATICMVHSEIPTFYRYFKAKGLQSVHYKAGFPDYSYEILATLIQLGFGSKEALAAMSRILHNLPRPKGYRETENLWLKISGMTNGNIKNIEMNCLVKSTPGWSEAGSNVDTGRTISIMAQMLKRGEIKAFGVTAPEACVPPMPFFKELKKRGMTIYRNGKELRL